MLVKRIVRLSLSSSRETKMAETVSQVGKKYVPSPGQSV